MASRFIVRRKLLLVLLVLFVASAALPRPALAAAWRSVDPIQDLQSFIASVTDGNRKVLEGVYVQGAFAYPVVQQHFAMDVAQIPDTVTQFGPAAMQGVTGLLAHNWLAGEAFNLLQPGMRIDLVYGDGRVDTFWVTEVQRYQVTMPGTRFEGYVNLETGRGTDPEGMFRRVYTGSRHVTFQTCIEKDGNGSWGRLFVIAEKEQPAAASLPALLGPDTPTIEVRHFGTP